MPENDFDGDALTGAVVAAQGGHHPGLDGEVDPGQSSDRPKALFHATQLE